MMRIFASPVGIALISVVGFLGRLLAFNAIVIRGEQ
jgi:hypothetical protein